MTSFEETYRALRASSVYRKIVAQSGHGLPDWFIPYSSVNASLLRRIAQDLQSRGRDTLLDVGCGFGGAGIFLAEQFRLRLLGVDVAEVPLTIAKELAHSRHVSARFEAADASRLPFESTTIDCAICIDALMFMDAPTVLSEIHRVLRSGGRLALTAPEAVQELLLPTMVRDYVPVLTDAGFNVLVHEVYSETEVQLGKLFKAIHTHAVELRAEVGDVANGLIEEAHRALSREGPPRVRHMYIIAEKP